MLEIRNNCLVLKDTPENSQARTALTKYLVKADYSQGKNAPVIQSLYYTTKDGDMIIPRGLDEFIPDTVPRVDRQISSIPRDFLVDYDKLAHSFGDQIVLRDDQLVAIRKMLKLRRGIIQIPTGGGKTEVMAGFLMAFRDFYGEIPPTLILEPTMLLVKSTIKRMNKYGIPAEPYSKSRGTFSGVMVTHPTSLNNDLEKDPYILKDCKIFLSDEGHHLQANTWNALAWSTPQVEFSIAMSASVISPGSLPIKTLRQLTYQESLVLGATGNVILDIPPSYYIQLGILATPILYRIYNKADEKVKVENDWLQLRQNKLESPYRNRLIAQVSAFCALQGYKVLILVGTKRQASQILDILNDYEVGDLSRCSFGGGQYLYYDTDTHRAENCENEDTMQDFEKGTLKILIGTSHIYEGADIPNLDVVILANIGKALRKCIQSVGRGLRRSKTGKYAHIVDFTDHQDPILAKHSRDRRKMLQEIVGIQPANTYEYLSFENFKQVFCLTEGKV